MKEKWDRQAARPLRCEKRDFNSNKMNSLDHSCLIFYAAYSGSVSFVAKEHAGNAAVEAEVARTGTTHRTAPIAAVGTDKAERTTAVEAVAR